jgi:glutaredoxin-like protein NrdH
VVTLLSQPGCGPCIAVKAFLNKYEIQYEERNVRTDSEAAALVRELEYTGTPVVIAPDGRHVGKFEPDFLNSLK